MNTHEGQRAAEHLRVLLAHQCRREAAESFAPFFADYIAGLSCAEMEALHRQTQTSQPTDFDDLGLEVTAQDLDALSLLLADELASRQQVDGSKPSALTEEAYEEVREAHEPSNNGNF